MSKHSTIINSKSFDLTLAADEESVELCMQLKTPFTTTKSIPSTFEFLQDNFPEVLVTKCYNKESLPFSEKVNDTQIGHLFEDVLLQLLAEDHNRTFLGVTNWDWREGKDPKGTYYITISVSLNEMYLLKNALRKAVELIEQLLGQVRPQPAIRPVYVH